MKYLDSNVFVYPAVYTDTVAKAVACTNILRKVLRGEIVAATSVLTWDEFVYAVKKCLGREIAVREGERFLAFPRLQFLKVDASVLSLAQWFMEKYALDPRDALHVATSVVNGIQEFVSDDHDFDGIQEIKRINVEDV